MRQASIILCTRDRAERLQATLDLLAAALRDDPTDAEIILIDNASTDDTSAVMERFARTQPPGRVIVLHEPTPGKSLALNRGARASTGEILVWLDDDIVVQPGWLAALVRPIQQGQADFVVGKISLPPHLLRDWLTPPLREKYGEVPSVNGGTYPVGGNTALRRSFWEESGGHDTRIGPGVPGGLGHGEDTLFSNVVCALGARLGYAADAAVEHHFEPHRLQRQDWLTTAAGQGRASAYIYYHWAHATTPLPLLRQWRKQVELFLWRLRHRPNPDPQSEGITIEELDLVKMIAFYRQYRIESHHPPRYQKRNATQPQ